MLARLLIPALLLGGAFLAPSAHAQGAETFRDWEAECGDALCVARTVTPGGAVSLRILREPGPDGPWEIAFAGMQEDIRPGTPVEISVDGARPMRFAQDAYAVDGGRLVLSDPRASAALFETLLRGNRATLAFTHKSDVPLRLTFSLAGLSAAAQWIEDNRERSGDAAQDQPAGPPEGAPDHLPAPPEQPADMVRPPETPSPSPDTARSEQATPAAEPVEIPGLVLERHFADGVCKKDYDPEELKKAATADRLDDHHTLYLLPCYRGAYNVIYRVWITDSRYPDEVERSLFAGYSDEQGWYGTDQIINADYDSDTTTLTAFEKGRGLGDCGSAPTYQWRAGSWRMMEYRYWSKCDGSRQPQDWPVVFEDPEK